MAEELASRGYVVIVQDLRAAGSIPKVSSCRCGWRAAAMARMGARAVTWAQSLPGTLPDVGMYGVVRRGRQLKWYLLLAADTRLDGPDSPPPHDRADPT